MRNTLSRVTLFVVVALLSSFWACGSGTESTPESSTTETETSNTENVTESTPTVTSNMARFRFMPPYLLNKHSIIENQENEYEETLNDGGQVSELKVFNPEGALIYTFAYTWEGNHLMKQVETSHEGDNAPVERTYTWTGDTGTDDQNSEELTVDAHGNVIHAKLLGGNYPSSLVKNEYDEDGKLLSSIRMYADGMVAPVTYTKYLYMEEENGKWSKREARSSSVDFDDEDLYDDWAGMEADVLSFPDDYADASTKTEQTRSFE